MPAILLVHLPQFVQWCQQRQEMIVSAWDTLPADTSHAKSIMKWPCLCFVQLHLCCHLWTKMCSQLCLSWNLTCLLHTHLPPRYLLCSLKFSDVRVFESAWVSECVSECECMWMNSLCAHVPMSECVSEHYPVPTSPHQVYHRAIPLKQTALLTSTHNNYYNTILNVCNFTSQCV